MRVLVFLLALTSRLYSEHDVETIVKSLDRLFRSDSSQVEMEMTIETPHWERSLSLSAWSRGLDDTFIVIRSPKKDKGISTLRLRNEMWNYFPKVDKVIKVPPSMMMGSWMGSDFTNDDLVKESTFLDDYETRIDSEDTERGHLVLILTPKEQTVSIWDKIEIRVRSTDYMPEEQAYFDERGDKVRILFLSEVRELGGRQIPTLLEMIPLAKEGHKTVVRYREAQFDQELPDSIFTIRNLKRRR